MVPECPKNTPGYLRSISKKSAKKIFIFFFSKSRGILSNVLAAKNDLLGGLKIPKIAPESKNAIFSKSEIMIPQSNLGEQP